MPLPTDVPYKRDLRNQCFAHARPALSPRGSTEVFSVGAAVRRFRICAMILECTRCSAFVDATLIAHYDDEDDESVRSTWFFCKCPRCTLPMVATSYAFDDAPPTRVYPQSTRRQLGEAVPKNIQGAFNEAVVCFNAKAFTASAIMSARPLRGCVTRMEQKARI
jgi:hypothetical protein